MRPQQWQESLQALCHYPHITVGEEAIGHVEMIFIKTCFHLPGLLWCCCKKAVMDTGSRGGNSFLFPPSLEVACEASSVQPYICQFTVRPSCHPLTQLPVGSHKGVSEPEWHLLCTAPPSEHSGGFQPFLNPLLRTVAVNDISPKPRGHRGKFKAKRESLPPYCYM